MPTLANRPLLTALWSLLALVLLAPFAARAQAPVAADAAPAATTPLSAVVTLPAFRGLLQPLLPEGSTVLVLIRPGRSEHGYEFTAADIASLSSADIVVYNGLELEVRVEQALARRENPARRVVSFADVLGLRQSSHEGHNHAPGEPCAHGPDWVDQHLWLDPVLVQRLLPALRDSVREALTIKNAWNDSERAALDARFEALQQQVAQIHREHEEQLAPRKGAVIITHHDAFSRLADRYGLRVAAVIRPGQAQESTPADIARVTRAVREQNARAIFIEPQFDPTAAQRLARRLNVGLGRLDPLGDGDWLALMRANLAEFVRLIPPTTPTTPTAPASPDSTQSASTAGSPASSAAPGANTHATSPR